MKTAGMSRRTPIGAELVNIILGMWLVISPFALGFSHNTAEKWSNIAVGLALVLVALAGAWGDGSFQGLVVPLGVWLFASAFVMGFSTAAFLANNVSMAFLVIAAGAISEGLRLPSPSKPEN